VKCSAIKRDGSPCTLQALRDSEFCWAHDPRNAEKRRQGQARGGRGPGKSLQDLVTLKAKLVQLGDDVMDGSAHRGDAAVAAQCYGVAVRAVEAEVKVRELQESRLVETRLKVREQEELLARFEEVERLLAEKKETDRRWGA
jgi:hypothetical protein